MYDDTRLGAELELLRSVFPDLEVRGHESRTWIRLPNYALPPGWSATTAEIAFCFPTEVGQPPYAFYVRPALTLPTGTAISNYTAPAVTPWGNDFGQFSWAPNEPWIPRDQVRAGANMLNFALSFASRLAEAS
jgi:hypothetical protein